MSENTHSSKPGAHSPLPWGLWPVMLTPFDDAEAVDYDTLDQLVDWYIEAGSAGLFACCLSSDMFQLSGEERLEMARRVVRRSGGRVPVVASGTFGDKLSESADFIRRMADTGVDAVVVVTNQPTGAADPEGVFLERLEALISHTEPIALGLYECPVPRKRLLSPEAVGWAARTGRFLYMKETSGDLPSFSGKVREAAGTSLGIYNAHNLSALESLEAGGAGLSPIGANFFPEIYAWLCRNWQSDYDGAERAQRWMGLIDAAIEMHYPVSARWFLRLRGLNISARCRRARAEATQDDAVRLGHMQVAFHDLCDELGITRVEFD